MSRLVEFEQYFLHCPPPLPSTQSGDVDNVLVPTLIFGYLLAGDNFNDDNKRCAGGRNGYGAKLANIYSTEFILETQDSKKYFRQKWESNMFTRHEAEIVDSRIIIFSWRFL